MTLTKTETALKGLIDETQAILAAQNDGLTGDRLQARLQEFLFRASTEVDTTTLNDITSAQYAEAVAVMRQYVFVSPEGEPSGKDGGTAGVAGWAEAVMLMAKYKADSLKWPPVLPTIAVVINLVRIIAQSGCSIQIRGKTCHGWQQFYETYADIILEA